MRKIYFVLAFLAIANISVGQNFTWTGLNGPDYQDPTNWTPNRNTPAAADNLLFNAVSPIFITNVPNQTVNSLVINSGTSSVSFETGNPTNVLNVSGATPLVFTTNGSLLASTFLTIRLSNAAPFTLSSGTFGIAAGTGGKVSINNAVTLNGGRLDLDVPGTGGTIISGSVRNITGIFNCINPGAITWTGTANYFHEVSGAAASAIPAGTWSTSSTCHVTGMNGGANAPTGLGGIDFYNFTWNCTGQTGAVNLNIPVTGMNVKGAMVISNTNNQYLRLAGTAGGTLNAATYTQTGSSNVMLQYASGITNLNVSSTFTHSGGVLDGVGGGASMGTANLNFKGNVNKSATWQLSSSSAAAQMNLEFSGSAIQNVNLTGAWNNPGAGRNNLTVSNTNIATGVALTTGSTLKVATGSSSTPATCTMSGVITPALAWDYISYVGPATLIYAGGFFQTAKAVEFPPTGGPTNLTIINALNVDFPTSFSRTLAGTLNMAGGSLSIGDGNTLTLTNSSLATQLLYTSGYITSGTLGRSFPTTGVPTTPTLQGRFPFGTGVNDRSMYVYFSDAALTGGAAGIIYVTHTPVVGVTPIPPTLNDNGIVLDKRTNTYWNITKDASFDIGSSTVALTVNADNIGSVDQYLKLRLTDAITGYGSLIGNTGDNEKPVTGKFGLTLSDITNKTLYIGSDGTTAYNPLTIITYTWTGAVSTEWKNPGNWTSPGATGYPSASTEIALINAAAPREPVISSGDNINVFQLIVASGRILTIQGNAGITVYNNVDFSGAGTPVFAPNSTFGYANPNTSVAQNVQDLPYENLTLSGLGNKILPSITTVRGIYSVTGGFANPGTGTFIYAGSGAQYVTPASYYNLTLTGNRGGGVITLGYPLSSVPAAINIANNFDVSGLSNFTHASLLPNLSFTTVNFLSNSLVTIPGFRYPSTIRNDGNGNRILDNQGSTDPAHEISCRAFEFGSGSFTVTNSKVHFYVSATQDPLVYTYGTRKFHDLKYSGNQMGKRLEFADGDIYIAGKFTMDITNYQQVIKTPNRNYFIFDGTADQIIPGFKTDAATNTPAFNYPNIIVQGGTRNVTLGADTIGITGNLHVFNLSSPSVLARWATITLNPFTSGKGFIVAGSTVKFSTTSNILPVLIPSSAGTYNYNNVSVNGGTRSLEASNMTIGGNLYVGGNDIAPAALIIGDYATNRVFNVLGNVTVGGTSSVSQATGQIELNPGNFATTLYISKNLTITGMGQISGTGSSNGKIVFKGTDGHTYQNTSLHKNGYVNFEVGDGLTNSKLTLLSTLDLVRSADPLSMGSLKVLANDTLDCSTFNITSNNISATGTGKFDLLAGATLVTSNTGGVEGTATDGSTGSILNNASLVRTYDPLASYAFYGNTSTPFPTAITDMANLRIGANVTLNSSVKVSNTFYLDASRTFNLSASDLTLRSTALNTARVAEVPASASINYGVAGRFNVERYYPARRAWRLATSPLSATLSVFDTWQNSGNFAPGIGTYVTGPAPSVANGLDPSPLNNVSLKAGASLTEVLNTKTTLLSGAAASAANLGYFIFVRGDRTYANTNTSNVNTTTLSSRGRLQTGTQTFPASAAANGFTLIGNPYASPVNFASITKNNIKNQLWVWDPYLNSEQGGYITFIEDLDNPGSYEAIPSSPGNLTQMIQSSQAFFVQTAANGSASVVFNEADKSVTNINTAFRPVGNHAGAIRTNLYLKVSDTKSILADGNLAQFDDRFTDDYSDREDILKLGNVKEMIAYYRNGRSLSVERRPAITSNDTLYLRITKTTKRAYRFGLVAKDFDASLNAVLEDNYTGGRIALNLTDTTDYDFTINNDVKSAAADRFRIVFKPSTVLPATYKSIKAYEQGAGITVEWSVENEINIDEYEVEESTDGSNFVKVHRKKAASQNGSHNYQFLDESITPGNNFYRIKSYDLDGTFKYSQVVLVRIGELAEQLSVYPNPVKGNTIGLSFNNMQKGNYNIRLSNIAGQTLMTRMITRTAGSSMETLTPQSTLSPGIYHLEVTAPDKRTNTIKVIVP